MTSRERLFAALEGQPTDRVPVWLLFPYHPIGCYVDVRTHPGYRPVFEASRRYAIMLDRRSFSVSLHTPDVVHRREECFASGRAVVRDHIEYAGQSVFTQVCPEQPGWERKKLLNSTGDLEFFCSLPIQTDPAEIAAELGRQTAAYLREKEEFPPQCGAMMLSLGEPIGALYQAANLEEYAVWSLTQNDAVVGLLERLMARWREIYRYCLERDLAEVYFLVGSELASPPLVGRDTFRRWIVPFARELIQMVRDAGRHAIQHYHGQIREILADFVEMGPHGLHTIESPPIGDCTLSEAFDLVGDDLTLIGNIQYDDFRSLPRQEMAQAVRRVLEVCHGKRFILSPTAGPYEDSPDRRILENYMVFMRTAWESPW